MNIVQK